MQQPYLMYLGDVPDQLGAKTAKGIVDWRPEWCLGQLKLEGCKADLGIDNITIAEAAQKGAKTMVIGIVNSGGFLPKHWIADIIEAMKSGLDVASGLHIRLSSIPEVKEAAEKYGRSLFDVRHPTQDLPTGKGTPRSGKRLLAVGTDCSVGKMYTTLAIEKEMLKRGMKADFRATGQTGIFIAGSGISIDAVVADFISGAVEILSPENEEDHWDIIEGQGSLFHPSFAGVSMGLLHGAQADALVLCHEPTRTHMRGLPHQPLPGFKECMDMNLQAAQLTNKNAKFVGISINTSGLSIEEGDALLKKIEDEYGLPTVDAFRTGVAPIVDNL
ncbi:N-acetyltransferase DgcN [Sneathiella glossodoripedis]|uniref:N-acetyltransferase DgcN n=1 Tax=Sneathiella glossodoripedis TaxID=418853 RepID=UPI0004709FBC|nr:N-acetyltransferase DgcN [Sneathiella glossodoripedis]